MPAGGERSAAKGGAEGSHNTRKIKGPVHAWYPYSECGAGCIAGDHDAPAAGPLTVAARALGMLRLPGLIARAFAAASSPSARRRSAAGPEIARTLLDYVGIDVILDAQPRALEALKAKGVFVAVNHHTWWDVAVLASIAPMRFIARDDLGRAPLVGGLVSTMGTVFIDRTSLRSLPGVVGESARLLREGHNVVAFPEATTWCGGAHGRFRPALFQAAIDAGTPVVPIEIEYRGRDGRRTAAAAFVGKDTVLSSVWNVISGRCATVHVRLYPPLRPGQNAPETRRDLAAVAHHVIFGDSGERTHG